MPATRPEAISNRIRLAYESRALVARLVAEDCAVDSVLAAVVDEDSPDEEGVSSLGSEHDLFAWTDELAVVPLPPVRVSIGGIVPFIELDAIKVAVLCKPPEQLLRR